MITLKDFSEDEFIKSKMPDLAEQFLNRAASLEELSNAIDSLGNVADATSFEEYARKVLESFDMLTAYFGNEVNKLQSDLETVNEIQDYVRLKGIGALNEDST